MAVYGYARVSTAEQAADDKSSLETQRRKIEAIAVCGDRTVDRMFEEPGASGGKALAERPAGQELLSVLRPGDTVIIAKLDRGFRNAADALATVNAWKERGIDLIVSDMGAEPVTQNGVSKMFFGMLALVAEFERERIKERLAEGRAGKQAKGGHIGGTAPFGYRVEGAGRDARLFPIPEQQVALATMRELRAAGLSFRAIAAQVEERHGLKVSHMAVKTALERAAE
ncbi:recombinase family protein [Azospirillum rugosum]|uniref:DNA invertase Pin-like site-specific DNA recombinase n=1 Tax=Azospirillum rugosum TaxID=416170 RepID=A0ABS4SQ68_9PROT|nr:recombinase family protein [Azospirillum rugosum]MBP2294708.1 DNA invertase Pin-like site-specific DNA recombinase [Azospirillum rugosum]MDQ0528003.1 DNA invertase Pin-like site-specific DNA recombinase [Azospirillum rugosum]